jgi:AcrR family transcriptional regulator
MGRPELRDLDPEREKLRSAIRAAALDAFSRRGFAQASMDEIAASCR